MPAAEWLQACTGTTKWRREKRWRREEMDGKRNGQQGRGEFWQSARALLEVVVLEAAGPEKRWNANARY
jgi:hypothetical protein